MALLRSFNTEGIMYLCIGTDRRLLKLPDDFGLLLLLLLLRRWRGGIQLLIGKGVDGLVERGEGTAEGRLFINQFVTYRRKRKLFYNGKVFTQPNLSFLSQVCTEGNKKVCNSC